MRNLLPLFIDVSGREVLLVGGGPVGAAKLAQLEAAGAVVRVVAPEVVGTIDRLAAAGRVTVARRPFRESDLDGVWLVVAAGSAVVNRQVAAAAAARRVFVNAVDDPVNASAYLSGVVRRAGVTIAISTAGDAPALTSLVREALEALLPHDLAEWMSLARRQRATWRRDAVPMERRKPLLLDALNGRYRKPNGYCRGRADGCDGEVSAAVPWLHGPEDSWL